MRTMHFSSCGRTPSRAALRVVLGVLWLGCTVLLAPASANERPVLGLGTDQVVNEGQLLDLSGIDAPPLYTFFDSDLADTHLGTVDWRDGTPIQNASVFESDGFGFLGGTHIFADNGINTVSVTVVDSEGASDTGVFNVFVTNVVPALSVTPSSTSITQGQPVNFSANFADPGYDNPLNPVVGGELVESFRYHVNWGDGLGTIASQDVADNNGGPFVPSTGQFNGSHTYSNGGIYTVAVRLADDDMGAYANSGLFASGVAGVDYVQYLFAVQVSPVPEPGAIVLTMIGLACLLAQRRRQMSTSKLA